MFTIDNSPEHNPDRCVDIMKVKPKDILQRFGQPDIIWASPPCQHFSIVKHKHWKNRRPKESAKESIKLVSHTLKLIINLFPKYWFLENPRGRLRFVLGKPYTTLFYGAYGHPILKPTDLWGYHPEIKWRTKIGGNLICYHKWYPGKNRQILRAIIPKELCEDIVKAREKSLERFADSKSKS